MHIKIYTLVNPINNHPFYVGATSQHLKIRLSCHISEILGYSNEKWNSKQVCIAQLKSIGKKPKIVPLQDATIYSVDYYEHFYYLMFIHQGYDLHQSPYHFTYRKQ